MKTSALLVLFVLTATLNVTAQVSAGKPIEPPKLFYPKGPPVVVQLNFNKVFDTKGNRVTSPYIVAIDGKRYYRPKDTEIKTAQGTNIVQWQGRNLDVVGIAGGFIIKGVAK